jgi:hypothetical protein
MVRFICALVLVLLLVSPSLGQQSLVGTYKIISQEVVVEGTPIQALGKAPKGYMVITPTRVLSFYVGDSRKFGTSVADKAALLDTLVGWSGAYRIEGSKMIISVDVSWTGVWDGKTEVRNFTLSGNRLSLRGEPTPYPRDPSKTSYVVNTWEKIE